MTVESGSKFGPYEIIAPLGAGGMGEVYKARDTRLDRTVAIKVLPSHLAERPDLRQRFEREAKAISSLSHPNICTLFDVGHESGVDYLVMEHLEGETLAERLTRGPLPNDQVLRYGIEIASALDKAHRQGVVHRDLKPGNVILTRSGAKVLDFGLAKVAAGPATSAAIDTLTSMPTQLAGTSPLTTEGTLLGTFQYMAPEQLEGAEADARSDIFALGSLLYEMATGRPAFQGKSRASLISAIMSSEPQAITSVQPLAPPALDRVIRTCLAKDPNDRIQTAHDVMLQLQWIAEGGSQTGVPAPVAARRKGRERMAWIVAAALLLITGALGFVVVNGARRPVEVTRLEATLPRSVAQVGSPKISPDGRYIAFDAFDSTGRSMVWLRPLGSLTAEPIASTEGLTARPFWSPDSRFIAFMAGGKLKKVAVTGGPAQTICDAPSGYDGCWSRDGVIAFDGGGSDPIRRVSAAGGVPTTAVPNDTGGVGWPEFLPDGRHMIYLRLRSSGANDIWLADLKSGKRRLLGVGGSRVVYSRAGYLLYVKDRTLLAQPFDIRAMRITGEPMPVVDGVGAGSNGLANFSVSNNGTLTYSTVGTQGNSQMAWLDRTGRVIAPVGPSGNMLNLSLAPDGKRVAIRIIDPQTSNRDIWVIDPDRGTNTRFTFESSIETTPVWSPDGSRIAFSSDRNGGVNNIYQKLSSGTGSDESVLASPNGKFLTCWSRDGRYLVYQDLDPTTGADIMVLPLFGDRKPIPFLHSTFNEGHGRLSPDSRWLAYSSDESGQFEVYVQAFPGPGGKWQISTRGGFQPMWRADGKELYYIATDGRLMESSVNAGDGFAAGVPTPLFNSHLSLSSAQSQYAPSADGQRFLLITQESGASLTPLAVVLDWNAEMKRR
jgi:serine/threonine protein kinase/WD40 repeat protein